MELEVVIPVRDKNIALLENCFKTVGRSRTEDVAISVVDLGSRDNNIYKELAKSMNFLYKYIEYPYWHKPVAMNYRLKRTNAEWFGVLDGDYILEEGFFSKIIENIAGDLFLQCRGYSLPDIEINLQKVVSHLDLANIIADYNVEGRPPSDYGGFQALPTRVGREVGGYDERFKWYGGMHHEMKERLVNYGLKMKRLHGDPLLLHQHHEQWVDGGSGASEDSIKKERKKHVEIIKELQEGNRIFANEMKPWG